MPTTKGEIGNLLLLALAFGLLWAAYRLDGWWLRRRYQKSQDNLITKTDNSALSLRLAGLFLGLALGLSGPLSSPSLGLLSDLLTMAWVGALILLLLVLAWLINAKLILSSIKNTEAVLAGNTAVGLVEMGGLLATGLIIRGAFSGQGTIISGVVFFFLGQLAMVAFFHVLEWLTPFNDQEEIARDNLPLGLHYAGMLISLGLVVSASVTGDFSNWSQDVKEFAYAVIKGMVLLMASSAITDRVFLHGTTAEREICQDRNPAAVILCLGVKLSLAMLIVRVML